MFSAHCRNYFIKKLNHSLNVPAVATDRGRAGGSSSVCWRRLEAISL